MKALPINQEFTAQYLQDLHGFFKLLRTSAYNIKFCDSSSHTAIEQMCSKLDTICRGAKKQKGLLSQTLSLSPNLLLEIYDHELKRNSNKQLQLSVGGCIEIKDGVLISQNFCIAVLCEVYEDMAQPEADRFRCHPLTSGTHVLRKFHFDIDRTLPDDCIWPRSHLQYGGKFTPEHFAVDDEDLQYHLFAPLDHPRFPVMPYSFILCMDLALRTFTTSGTSLTKESCWKKKVKESESRWIRPFLENAIAFIDANNSTETLWDFFSYKK